MGSLFDLFVSLEPSLFIMLSNFYKFLVTDGGIDGYYGIILSTFEEFSYFSYES